MKNYNACQQPGSNELVFTALGGLSGIGSNLYVYGHKGKWLIVDFGIGFAQTTIPGVEVIMPDISFLQDNKPHIVGLILTHAHEDHVGALAYMYDRLQLPIYATAFTANFAKYKLAEAGLENKVPIHVVAAGEVVDFDGFKVEFVAMAHSIPEPQALKFHMPFGTVLHTGDWKVDKKPMIGDSMQVSDLSSDNVYAVIGDSTNVMTPKHTESEGDVRQSIVDLVSGLKGGVAVTCFASNLARLESFILAAKACRRKVVFVGKSLWRMLDCAQKSGYFQDVGEVYEADAVRDICKSKLMYICTGSQGEWRAGLARVARNEHRHVQLGTGDTVIFSARCIPGNELSVGAIQNMLVDNGADIINTDDAFVHASGHGSSLEIAALYTHLKPKYAIPMHGESLHLQRHAQLAQTCGVEQAFVLKNGDVLSLSAEGVLHVGQVPTGVCVLDGTQITAVDNSAIRQRKKMGFCGLTLVSIALDSYGSLLCEPQIQIEGLHMPDEADKNALIDLVIYAVENLSNKDVMDDGKVIETVRLIVRRVVMDKTGKKNTVKIHVLRTE